MFSLVLSYLIVNLIRLFNCKRCAINTSYRSLSCNTDGYKQIFHTGVGFQCGILCGVCGNILHLLWNIVVFEFVV